MTYIQGASFSSVSESVSYTALSYVLEVPVIETPVLSKEDQRKLEYSLEKHKAGLRLLSQ